MCGCCPSPLCTCQNSCSCSAVLNLAYNGAKCVNSLRGCTIIILVSPAQLRSGPGVLYVAAAYTG